MANITLKDFSELGQQVLEKAFAFQGSNEKDINGYLKSEAGNFYAQIFLIQAELISDSLMLRHGRSLRLDNISDTVFNHIYLFEDRSMLFNIDENNSEVLEFSSTIVDALKDNSTISAKFECFFGRSWLPPGERKPAVVAEYKAQEKTRLSRSSQKRSERMRAYWDQQKREHPEEIITLNQKRSEWMKKYWGQRKAANY